MNSRLRTCINVETLLQYGFADALLLLSLRVLCLIESSWLQNARRLQQWDVVVSDTNEGGQWEVSEDLNHKLLEADADVAEPLTACAGVFCNSCSIVRVPPAALPTARKTGAADLTTRPNRTSTLATASLLFKVESHKDAAALADSIGTC